MMKLLYYSPASYGGIADYAHEQANALVDVGVEVTFLCTPNYPTGRGEKYKIVPILQEIAPKKNISNKIFKSIHFITVTLSNITKLANFIEKRKFQYVLFASYLEYLAPIWSGKLKKLAKKGVIFGSVVHDPVRNFIVGPQWWHNWSVACGYSFLREAFVHESIQLDTIKPIPELNTTVIPHGAYHFANATQSREKMRSSLDLPKNAKVMLAFGHIRDNKNLDLVIRAMVNFFDLYLIIAGKEQSSGHNKAGFYYNLAKTVGVADRCRWKIEFIPDAEVANLFKIADLVILTYDRTFQSASGVLNTAVSYRKLCLASGGEGNFHSVVQKYQLGIWINPDDLDAIVTGIRQCLDNPPHPQWEKYLAENSWQNNVQLVIKALSRNLS